MKDIIIDDGSVKAKIKNKQGKDLGTLYFNPSDMGMMNRWEDFIDKMDEIDHIDDANFKEVSDKIVNNIDELVKGASSFFEVTHPLSLSKNGDFYFEKVVEILADIIEEQTNQRIERKLKKIEKVTGKYVGVTNDHKPKQRNV